MTDDPTPRRRLGLPGQVRPGEQLETVFRDELPAEDADPTLPGYPLSREQAAAAGEWAGHSPAADLGLTLLPESASEPVATEAGAHEWVEPLAADLGLAAPAEPEAGEARAAAPLPGGLAAEADAAVPAARDEWVEPLAREARPEAVAVEVAAEPAAPAEQEAGDQGEAPAQPGVPAVPGARRRGRAGGGESAAGEEGEPDPLAAIPLKAALEAVLMVVDEPTTATRLAEVLDRPRKLVTAALAELAAEYDAQQRGFELRYVAGGWRFYTRALCAPAVDRFVLDGQQARLTQAALETLAVIAYRQPVSRSRVSAVRGVNCDGVMRTLVQRGLVEESGTEPETGAYLYRTTHYFLERMGLRGLDELPELAPFLPEADDVEADSQEGSAIADAVAGAE